MTKIHAHVTNPLAGTIYVILSAIFFSIGGVLIKMIPWSPLAISGTRSIFALIVMLIYMKLIGHRFVLNRSVLFGGICSAIHETVFTPSVCIAVVMLGVVQIGFAYICLSRGLDAVSPVTASLTSGIEPVLNPILVAIFYGETIGPLSMAGAVLVIGSVLAYSLSQIRHPKPAFTY